ncbi:MAG: hypothetical protein NC489_38810, partial [Ruminococcus flavefaciens]|nr:hypothetical protein [Ruminococcus flavefaciens]
MKRELIKAGIAVGMSLMLAVGGIAMHSVVYQPQNVLAEQVKKGAAVAVNVLDYESNSSAKEFSVNNVEGMEKIAELVNSGTESFDGKTIKMTDNIYFEKTIKNNHVPIGTAEYDFKGIFDGDNHVISGMQITINQSHIVEYKYSTGSSNSIWVGLFGVIGGKSEIKNILLKDSEVKYGSLSSSYEGYFEPALLVGNDSYGGSPIISNCHIDAASKLDMSGVGAVKEGIFASAAIMACGDNTTIQYCTNGASIKVEGDFTWVGGISGYIVKKIKGCYNYGNITQI